jgi:hypothetical protein
VLTGEPSPKFHEYDSMKPSLSFEPAGEKCTNNGACPDVTSAPANAIGAWFDVVPPGAAEHAAASSATTQTNGSRATRAIFMLSPPGHIAKLLPRQCNYATGMATITACRCNVCYRSLKIEGRSADNGDHLGRAWNGGPSTEVGGCDPEW